MIARLESREGARELIARVASRAGVELTPAACWLLARLSEPGSARIDELASAAEIDVERLARARDELDSRGLIQAEGRRPSGHQLTSAGRATLALLTETGEQRLSDLLEGWRPQEHPDLAHLIARLAREFFIDAAALRQPAPVAAPAAA
jgi:DNA-binding MarR family transcriptional regulator